MKECNHPTCEGECRKKKPKKPRKPIKKRSDKRAKLESAYSRIAKGYKIMYPLCRARVPEAECEELTKDVHHMAGREGDLLLMIEYWMPVCRNCHTWIHRNPGKAREIGLLKRA